MTSRLFLILLLVFSACAHRPPRKGTETAYRLITELPDDLKKPEKAAVRSKAALELDFDTGHFKGWYKNHDFTGNYIIEHVSAGFVKGFFYRVRMENLNRPESGNTEENAFFEHLSTARRLYVAPDKRVDPAYTVLEISSAEPETKLIFIKINP